jgi:hypothetical protein
LRPRRTETSRVSFRHAHLIEPVASVSSDPPSITSGPNEAIAHRLLHDDAVGDAVASIAGGVGEVVVDSVNDER